MTPSEHGQLVEFLGRQFTAIDRRFTDEHGRREILERDLAALKHHVAALQARIEDLEQRLGR